MAAAVVSLLAGCGHGGSPTGAAPRTGAPVPPDLKAFLQLPVATPAACPSHQTGSTIGRVSPWTGHVDVSVFLRPRPVAGRTSALRRLLRREPLVARTYYETPQQAHAEFARLYTCSAAVAASQTPASFRLVLRAGTTTAERNGLVAQLLRQPGVETASCDPSNPCVDVVRSEQASPPPR